MSSRVSGTPEWERENLQVSYPFVADPVATAQSDGIRGSVVDATLSVAIYSPSVPYSLKVSRASGVTSVTVYRSVAEIAGPADIIGTVVAGDFAVTSFLKESAGELVCAGAVITTSLDFAEGTAVLLPGRVFPARSGVYSLRVDELGEGAQSGALELDPGNNLRAELNGQEILLIGEKDPGCSVPGTPETLLTICGIPPDEKGDIRITQGAHGCVSVLPYPPDSQVILRSDCGSPSPRKGRAASYEKLLRAAAIYHLVATALNGVNDRTEEVVDNLTTFISERVEPPA